MTLPAHAARALEQVKLGLAILYGANYFSEDEWTKIGVLVGIEQPKPTPGRSDHILDEPLISLLDTNHEPAEHDVNKEDMIPEQDAPTVMHDTFSTKDKTALPLELKPGSILIAQSNYTKKGKVQISASAGDQIKIIKKVSGIMYLGENLQTKQSGQVPNYIFQKSTPAYRKDSSNERSMTVVDPKTFTSVDSFSAVVDLDKIEGTNAAEWEKDDASVATSTLSLPRHDMLDSEDSTRTSLVDEGQQSDEGSLMRAMVSKMVDERMRSVQKVGSKAVKSNPLLSRNSKSRNMWTELPNPVGPKTHICWFYATPNKECRFTAEECRDLHEPYPSIPGSLSLRMGRPTWGALADSSPPLSLNESVDDSKGKAKTCWYWANTTCSNTTKTCQFLHEHVPGGVMPHPHKSRRQRATESISCETDDGQNDVTMEWAHQQRVERAWTESSVEKYKPPHMKF